MTSVVFLTLALVAVGAQDFTDVYDVGQARLVASKNLLSSYAVQDKEFVIEYAVFNIGDRPANKVVLDDRLNFQSQYFELVSGSLFVKWPRIASGQNVSHIAVLKPLEIGFYNVSSAQITYRPSEVSDEEKMLYTSAIGEITIYRLKDYEKRFSSHLLDWIVFLVMAAPCVALPAMLWLQTHSKYEALVPKKKA